MTWGMVMSITLSFIENSLRWLLFRKSCNLFGTINGLLSMVFLLVCLYTWMWANDGAGIIFICKYVLLSVGVRSSPD